MEVPTLSQVATRRAFQAAHDLHQTLLPHNNQLNMQDQSTSPLVSQTEPCLNPTCAPQVPRKSVKFTENLQIRFLIPGQDGEIIFHRNQIMKDRQHILPLLTILCFPFWAWMSVEEKCFIKLISPVQVGPMKTLTILMNRSFHDYTTVIIIKIPNFQVN